jgi:hypothetical protein
MKNMDLFDPVPPAREGQLDLLREAYDKKRLLSFPRDAFVAALKAKHFDVAGWLLDTFPRPGLARLRAFFEELPPEAWTGAVRAFLDTRFDLTRVRVAESDDKVAFWRAHDSWFKRLLRSGSFEPAAAAWWRERLAPPYTDSPFYPLAISPAGLRWLLEEKLIGAGDPTVPQRVVWSAVRCVAEAANGAAQDWADTPAVALGRAAVLREFVPFDARGLDDIFAAALDDAARYRARIDCASWPAEGEEEEEEEVAKELKATYEREYAPALARVKEAIFGAEGQQPRPASAAV